jgi:hypothetical protein
MKCYNTSKRVKRPVEITISMYYHPSNLGVDTSPVRKKLAD